MKKLKNRLHSRSGETLLEVLVAILIVTTVTAALVQSIVVSNRINKTIKDEGLDRSLDYTTAVDVDSAGNAAVASRSITGVTASESDVISNGGVYVQSLNDGTYFSYSGPRS